MIEPNITAWSPVGESLNTQYYRIDEHVLAAVPRRGSIDDGQTAADNVRFQNRYFERIGGGVVLVFFDLMTSQDSAARKVYQSAPDMRYMLGTGLVGGTLLSRAMGSFFLGLSKPSIPLKMFGSLDDALVWARERKRAQLAREGTT
jgi:hypothetical protein